MATFINPVLFLYKIKNFEIQAQVAARVPPFGPTVGPGSSLALLDFQVQPQADISRGTRPARCAGKSPGWEQRRAVIPESQFTLRRLRLQGSGKAVRFWSTQEFPGENAF